MLAAALNDWLKQFPEGKAIVFCDRPELAQHLSVKLSILLDYPVERYLPGQTLQFTQPQSPIRVLLCDKSGEDGLNLHGGAVWLFTTACRVPAVVSSSDLGASIAIVPI